MRKRYVLDIIDRFSKKYHLKVFYDWEDLGSNRGETDGKYIFFGPYSNNEYLLISFFHEFAHCVLRHKVPGIVKGKHWNNTTTMQFEIQITMAGLNFAQKHGIVFSDKAVKWLLQQNLSYKETTND